MPLQNGHRNGGDEGLFDVLSNVLKDIQSMGKQSIEKSTKLLDKLDPLNPQKLLLEVQVLCERLRANSIEFEDSLKKYSGGAANKESVVQQNDNLEISDISNVLNESSQTNRNKLSLTKNGAADSDCETDVEVPDSQEDKNSETKDVINNSSSASPWSLETTVNFDAAELSDRQKIIVDEHFGEKDEEITIDKDNLTIPKEGSYDAETQENFVSANHLHESLEVSDYTEEVQTSQNDHDYDTIIDEEIGEQDILENGIVEETSYEDSQESEAQVENDTNTNEINTKEINEKEINTSQIDKILKSVDNAKDTNIKRTNSEELLNLLESSDDDSSLYVNFTETEPNIDEETEMEVSDTEINKTNTENITKENENDKEKNNDNLNKNDTETSKDADALKETFDDVNNKDLTTVTSKNDNETNSNKVPNESDTNFNTTKNNNENEKMDYSDQAVEDALNDLESMSIASSDHSTMDELSFDSNDSDSSFSIKRRKKFKPSKPLNKETIDQLIDEYGLKECSVSLVKLRIGNTDHSYSKQEGDSDTDNCSTESNLSKKEEENNKSSDKNTTSNSGTSTDDDIDRLCDLSTIKKHKRSPTSKKVRKKLKKQSPKNEKKHKDSKSGSATTDLSEFETDLNDINKDLNDFDQPKIGNSSESDEKSDVDPNELLAEIVCHTIRGSSDSEIEFEAVTEDVKKKKKKHRKHDNTKSETTEKIKKEVDLEKKAKKKWRNDPLLRGRLSSPELISDSSTSDEENDINKNIKEKTPKKRKNRIESGDSSGSSSADYEPKETIGRTRKKNSGSDSSSSSSDEFQIKHTPTLFQKFRKRPKENELSSDSDIEIVKKENISQNDKKSDKDVEEINNEGDKAEDESEKSKKGRRNIRALLSEKELDEETRKAKEEEQARISRLTEKQKQLQNYLSQSQPDESDRILLDNTVDGKEIYVDSNLANRMYSHQVEGVKFMWDALYESVEQIEKGNKGSGCILAHCMGLGKTFQVVTLIHTLFANKEATKTKHCLIVCPVSTINGWRHELKIGLHCAEKKIDLKIFSIGGIQASKYDVIKRWKQKSGILILGYQSFEILTNPKRTPESLIESMLEALMDPGPNLVVCDEGHLLKSAKTLRTQALMKIKTKRRIILTGTPLQNSLKEYYHMVQFVKPNLLGTLNEYANRFVNPITNGQFEDSSLYDIKIMKKRSHVLNKILNSTVQRVEVSELRKHLNKILDYTVFVKLHPVQNELYKKYLSLAKDSSESEYMKGFLNDFHLIRHITSHPIVLHLLYELASKKVKPIKEKETIDQDQDNDQENCVEGTAIPKDWWKPLCPEDFKTSIEVGHKFAVMLTIIEECEKISDKILIFSNSLSELNGVEYVLQQFGTPKCKRWKKGKDYLRMDGTVSPSLRTDLCNKFNDPNNQQIRVFIMTQQVGGLGLNLTAANRVIILGVQFNPSNDSQSIYRAYRFGQKKSVYVYRLVSLGTMEEKQYQRCVTKLAIACRVVDKHQIDRHYKIYELQEMYNYEENTELERPTPIRPEDDLLSAVVMKCKYIWKFHLHEELLQNRPNEELNEEDKKAAWDEFVNENDSKAKAAAFNATLPSLPSHMPGLPVTISGGVNIPPSTSFNPPPNHIIPGSNADSAHAAQVLLQMQNKFNAIYNSSMNQPLANPQVRRIAPPPAHVHNNPSVNYNIPPAIPNNKWTPPPQGNIPGAYTHLNTPLPRPSTSTYNNPALNVGQFISNDVILSNLPTTSTGTPTQSNVPYVTISQEKKVPPNVIIKKVGNNPISIKKHVPNLISNQNKTAPLESNISKIPIGNKNMVPVYLPGNSSTPIINVSKDANGKFYFTKPDTATASTKASTSNITISPLPGPIIQKNSSMTVTPAPNVKILGSGQKFKKLPIPQNAKLPPNPNPTPINRIIPPLTQHVTQTITTPKIAYVESLGTQNFTPLNSQKVQKIAPSNMPLGGKVTPTKKRIITPVVLGGAGNKFKIVNKPNSPLKSPKSNPQGQITVNRGQIVDTLQGKIADGSNLTAEERQKKLEWAKKMAKQMGRPRIPRLVNPNLPQGTLKENLMTSAANRLELVPNPLRRASLNGQNVTPVSTNIKTVTPNFLKRQRPNVQPQNPQKQLANTPNPTLVRRSSSSDFRQPKRIALATARASLMSSGGGTTIGGPSQVGGASLNENNPSFVDACAALQNRDVSVVEIQKVNEKRPPGPGVIEIN